MTGTSNPSLTYCPPRGGSGPQGPEVSSPLRSLYGMAAMDPTRHMNLSAKMSPLASHPSQKDAGNFGARGRCVQHTMVVAATEGCQCVTSEQVIRLLRGRQIGPCHGAGIRPNWYSTIRR